MEESPKTLEEKCIGENNKPLFCQKITNTEICLLSKSLTLTEAVEYLKTHTCKYLGNMTNVYDNSGIPRKIYIECRFRKYKS